MRREGNAIGGFIFLIAVVGIVLVLAQGCCCEPPQYPPLNELNPKARYVIIDDDEGNHLKLDKAYIKSVHVSGSYIYISYGDRNLWAIVYPDDSRRREMFQRILTWWKAG